MKTVVNLTQQSVIGEIESVLDTYPYHPYQQAFAIPDLRQELIAFVLNRIPSFYSVISDGNIPLAEAEQESLLNYQLPRKRLEQQLHLQNLIHQGICSIVQEKSDWISHHLCEIVQLGCEPSHWFG
ncbi:hypothetical protein VF14_08055 [Nostoc linckia z18]|jgi:hypothetical protein|uniref:Late competence development ComFB family protein n=2 Tax=Nostoc linckia TaxID=92942 RepID=A0A9Q5ZEG4_NOSLI|nr:hypothetical protein [Nostoc linckia]PHK36633.1 hypothetical protein VF12_21120 [Nostoc linckia z15]PHK47191.1 hypothetical protein VF13_06670 [Nostoc linckia z16]PHJ63892.1 hypothetical protein VF02_13940 [Nostoc linckia z1]PHJ69462.1 hypothetical protein VF05_13575 [Nostoc linckia z3]PHJ74745.1 hypothetical protein VF03_13020 [Nostoc linckia z2]